MERRFRKLSNLKKILNSIIFLGSIIGAFYFGIIFNKGTRFGFFQLVKEQGINVLFGVIGGLITSLLIWQLKEAVDNFRKFGKKDKLLSGTWDEQYEPAEYETNGPEQSWIFNLEHYGENIEGKLTGNDNSCCPQERKHGIRSFIIEGKVEGGLVSINAMLDSDFSSGHIVYLFVVNQDYTVLEGKSIFFDINYKKLASCNTILRKRKKN